MLSNWTNFIKIKSFTKPKVVIGGKARAVKPLGLQAALELMILLAPYLATIEANLGNLRGSYLLRDIFTMLHQRMSNAPGDILKAMSLLLDCEVEWLAPRITAQEFLAALPILDEVNNFGELWAIIQGLGLVIVSQERGQEEKANAQEHNHEQAQDDGHKGNASPQMGVRDLAGPNVVNS